MTCGTPQNHGNGPSPLATSWNFQTKFIKINKKAHFVVFVFLTSQLLALLFCILRLLVIHCFLSLFYVNLKASSLDVDFPLVFHHGTSKLEESLHHHLDEVFQFPSHVSIGGVSKAIQVELDLPTSWYVVNQMVITMV